MKKYTLTLVKGLEKRKEVIKDVIDYTWKYSDCPYAGVCKYTTIDGNKYIADYLSYIEIEEQKEEEK